MCFTKTDLINFHNSSMLAGTIILNTPPPLSFTNEESEAGKGIVT